MSEGANHRAAPIGATVALARGERGRLLGAALLGAAAVGATVALMGTSAWMLSRASEQPGEAALGVSIVAVQIFGLSRGLLRYAERLVGHDAAFRLLASLRVRFFNHVEKLAPAGLRAFSRGELVTRMVADVDDIQELLLRVVPPFVTALAVGAGTVLALWLILPAASAITFAALILGAIAVPWLTRWLTVRSATRTAELRGQLATSFGDLVDGAAELAVYGGAHERAATVAELDAKLRRADARGAATTGIGIALATALAGLAAVGNLVVGSSAVASGRLSGALLGTLAVVPLAAFELVAPLPQATQALHRARECAGRIFEVLDTPAPVQEPLHPIRIAPGTHHIQLRGTWASYPTSNAPVLRGVDLDLRRGELVAVVGHSGSGKSTLASVLMGFLPAAAGRVSLDGRPYGAYDSDEIRGVVGLVEQVPHLFDTTLAANLRVAKPDATDDELVGSLRAVGLGPLLDSLPDGLAVQVGTSGSKLSGGQRQRVAVARALLADRPVLVLDEPTEHLEPRAADELLDAILRGAAARATLLITHRMTGLERADEILVLDHGAVAERGTHAALLAASGRYAAWWWEERRTSALESNGSSHDEPSGVLAPTAHDHVNQGGRHGHG